MRIVPAGVGVKVGREVKRADCVVGGRDRRRSDALNTWGGERSAAIWADSG